MKNKLKDFRQVRNLSLEDLELMYAKRRDKYGMTILLREHVLRIAKPHSYSLSRKGKFGDLLHSLETKNLILDVNQLALPHPFEGYLQERLRPLLVPSEWTSKTWFEATLACLQAQKIAHAHQMTLDDAHPWNIGATNSHPVIIDLGAFDVMDSRNQWDFYLWNYIWPAQPQFRGMFINTAYLLAAKQQNLVRRVSVDYFSWTNTQTATLLISHPIHFFFFTTQLAFEHGFNLLVLFALKLSKGIWRRRIVSVLRRANLRMHYLYVERLKRVSSAKQQILDNMGEWKYEEISQTAPTDFTDAFQEGDDGLFGAYVNSPSEVKLLNHLSLSPSFIYCEDDLTANSVEVSNRGQSLIGVLSLRSPTPSVGPCYRWATSAL